jgi:hypothetical protein
MHLRHRRLSDDTRAERKAEEDLLARQAKYYNSAPYMPKQSTFEDETFELPKPIQAISNAADHLFDLDEQLKSLSDQREGAKLTLMGAMRAADKMIYKHRDLIITIEGVEKLKVKAPKKVKDGWQ